MHFSCIYRHNSKEFHKFAPKTMKQLKLLGNNEVQKSIPFRRYRYSSVMWQI